ncbi:LuxR C-terminal-related transcriptional regulator [Paenibacillus hodogayensis]|uniref:LuxR C-terminal-related transcriptional regulator n=1 Tax=Paenibacillus hodogayensis TaxID=279208 RepID=A0ABV5VQX1_9BACL
MELTHLIDQSPKTADSDPATLDSEEDRPSGISADYAKDEHIRSRLPLPDNPLEYLALQAESRQERLQLYRAQIAQLTDKGQYAEVLTLGLHALKQEYGIRIPLVPGAGAVSKARSFVKKQVPHSMCRPVSPLQADHPDALASIEFVQSLLFPAVAARRNVFIVLMAKFVQLTMRHGNNPGSPAAYAIYGLHLCYDTEQYAEGIQLAQEAYEFSKSMPLSAARSTVTYVLGKVTFHWGNDAETGEALLLRAIEQGKNEHNYAFVGLAMIEHVHAAYTRGTLEHIYVLIQQYLPFVIEANLSLRHLAFCDYLQLIGVYTDSLSESAHDSVRLNGSYADDRAEDKADNPFQLFRICTFRTQQHYLQEHYEEAVRTAEAAIPHLSAVRIVPLFQEHLFYYALAICAAWDLRGNDEKSAERHRLKRIREQMGKWAAVNPGYYKHKHELISAEIARLSGQASKAIDLYQKAIFSTREGGYIQDWAVANELFARFLLSMGIVKAARLYMNDAYEGFKEWGASIKTTAMRNRYPDLLPKEETHSKAEESDRRLAVPVTANEPDLSSVLKAAQSFLEESNPELLLRKLVRIVIDNTGAERVCMLVERDGRLYVELVMDEAGDGAILRRPVPLERYPYLASSVVVLAASTLTPLKVDDVRLDGRFRNDPYVRYKRPKSILCLPISRPGYPNVVLYLENHSVPSAFVLHRYDVLQLLACQTYYATTMLGPAKRAFPSEQAEADDSDSRLLLLDPLTVREIQVLRLMAGGLSNREISDRIGIVVGTVKNHIKNIFSKLGVSSRMKAVSQAKDLQLLSD